jgi:hypothetical protein
MQKPDVKTICGGLFVAALGLFFSLQAFNYDIGTSQRMGPGYFPLLVGAITAAVGVLLVLAALRRPGARPAIAWRPLLAVLGGIAAFGTGLRFFGLIPAVLATIFCCSLGDRSSRPLATAVLAAFVAAGAWLLFVVGLELPFRALSWGQP